MIRNYRSLLGIAAAALLLAGCAQDKPDSAKAPNTLTTTTSQPTTKVSTPGSTRVSRSATARPSDPDQTFKRSRKTTESLVAVHGRITLPGQAPASSATVELFHHRPGIGHSKKLAETVTDSEGRYRVQAEDASALALRISGNLASTYLLLEPDANRYTGKPGLREIKKDVEVAQGSTLSGRVTDAAGHPLAGVPVHLTPSFKRTPAENKSDTRPRDTWKTTTTAKGAFDFPHLGSGLWVVGAKAPGLAPRSIPANVPTDGPVTIQLAASGGTVQGKVVHKQTGAAISGITVQLGPGDMNQLQELEHQLTTSTADGSFRFENLSTGPLRLWAEGSDQKLWMATPRPAPLRMADGESTEVTMFMYPGHTITGMVYDKDTSEPLSGAVVSTFSAGKNAQAKSDSSGTYMLQNIVPYAPNANLQATLEGYAAAIGESSHRLGWINVPLAEDGSPARADIPMEQMIAVSGKVVTQDEVPVSNATVRMHSSDMFGSKGTPVSTDGTFTLYLRPFSDGHIEAEAHGFVKTVLDSIKVANQPLNGLKIVMKVGATVQGRVTDSSGKPVEDAELQVTHQFGSFGYIHNDERSGADSKFMISDLPENVEILARKEGYAQSEKQALTLAPGEIRPGVNLVLRNTHNHTISGVVIMSDGKPVSRSHVSIYPSGGYNSAMTNEDGTFTIDGLPEGTYDLQVSTPEHTIVRSIKTGTTDLKIIIEAPKAPKSTVTLLGTVVDDITGDLVRDFDVKILYSKLPVEKLNEPGKFQISGMNVRTAYSITITSPDHEDQVHQTEPGSDGEQVEQTFRLTTPGGITGRVVMTDGKPGANLTVANYGLVSRARQHSEAPMKHTTTDEDGKFTLAPSPAGTNALKILAPEPYAALPLEVEVKSGEITDLGDVVIGGGGALRGRVVRGQQQEAVAGIEVQVSGWTEDMNYSKAVTTDENGRFEVLGLQDAQYSITAGNARTDTEIKDGAAADVVLELGGVTVSGKVTSGVTPYQGWVMLTSKEHRYEGMAKAGTYTIENVKPGQYDIRASSPSGEGYTEPVTIPDQPEFQKDIVIPDGRIRVILTDEQGKPASGVRMDLSGGPLEGTRRPIINSSQPTGPDGVYVFTGLVPGTYTLTVATTTERGKGIQQVQVNNGETKDVKIQTRKSPF